MKVFDKVVSSFARHGAVATIATLRKRKALMLSYELQRRAMNEAADFVMARMPDAMFCRTRKEVFDVALRDLGPGQILEFGVYRGATINDIAGRFPDRKVYGFDSFEGLPTDWSGNRYSDTNFDRGGVMPKVGPNVELIKGWFDNTVPPFFASHQEPIAMLHVDCDIYSSTVTVMTAARPFIRRGTRIVFDEFFNYPGYQHHEMRALNEFAAATQMTYRFTAYSGEQAALEVESIDPA